MFAPFGDGSFICRKSAGSFQSPAVMHISPLQGLHRESKDFQTTRSYTHCLSSTTYSFTSACPVLLPINDDIHNPANVNIPLIKSSS